MHTDQSGIQRVWAAPLLLPCNSQYTACLANLCWFNCTPSTVFSGHPILLASQYAKILAATEATPPGLSLWTQTLLQGANLNFSTVSSLNGASTTTEVTPVSMTPWFLYRVSNLPKWCQAESILYNPFRPSKSVPYRRLTIHKQV